MNPSPHITPHHTTQCPISLGIIEDGVVAADGVTYERAAIEKWFKDGRVTSPMTNAPMEHQHLTPVSVGCVAWNSIYS